MKFKRRIIDFLIKLNPGRYDGYIVYENGKKVIYVKIIRAIYGMIIASFYGIRSLEKISNSIGLSLIYIIHI